MKSFEIFPYLLKDINSTLLQYTDLDILEIVDEDEIREIARRKLKEASGHEIKYLINCLPSREEALYILSTDSYDPTESSKKGYICVLKYILHNSLDISLDDTLRWTSLNGPIEVVRLLLEAGANIHGRDDWALRWASHQGRTEVVQLLLEAGANVHAEDDKALQEASKRGHVDVVRILLEFGANIHARDDWALRTASRKGHTDVVRLLAEYGANI